MYSKVGKLYIKAEPELVIAIRILLPNAINTCQCHAVNTRDGSRLACLPNDIRRLDGFAVNDVHFGDSLAVEV